MRPKSRGSRSRRASGGRAVEALEPLMMLAADPIIAEFQAINDTTLRDADGDFSDWIEIRNSDTQPINLAGWYLTDDATDLRKWRFPAASVPADGQLIVFASRKDRTDPVAELHTNFALSGDGEYLALVKPDGITVAHAYAPQYPPQVADQSYGVAVGRDVTTLIERGHPVRALVPENGALGASWNELGFDDSDWVSGTTAVGYEIPPSPFELRDEFDSPLGPEWTVDIPAGSSSTVSVNAGQLVFETPSDQDAGNVSLRGRAPFVYQDAPLDAIRYEVITRVQAPGALGAQGIVVFDAASGRSGLRLEYQGREFFRLVGPDGNELASDRRFGRDAYELRLQRDDFEGTWTAYFRFEETEDWIELGGVQDASEGMLPIADPRLGVQVNTSADAQVTQFEDFTIVVPEQPAVYGPHLGLDVASQMHSENSGIYLRMPFTLDADPAQLDEVSLAVSYDDGFRAYLNGQEIAAANSLIESTWDSAASVPYGAVSGHIPLRSFDVSDALSLLRTGENVLSVHGMNVTREDSDFFLDPTLTVSHSVSRAAQAFVTPTPGEMNSQRALPTPRIIGEQGAFFGTRTVEIVVDNVPASVEIRYTTDGTLPRRSSHRYSGPTVLVEGAMLQARAFDLAADDALEPSNVAAATFVALAEGLRERTSDVPLVIVDTMGQIVPDTLSTDWAASNVLFYNLDDLSQRSALASGDYEYLGRGGVRRRGSSTGGQPKPNLAFELWGPDGTSDADDFDASLAGLPADSDWVLHGPYQYDHALIRNRLFFELGGSVLEWVPRTRPIEVYLNEGDGIVSEDDYVGAYVLMEKVKQGKDRLPVAEISPEDSDPDSVDITGGYIFKSDRPDPGDTPFSAGGRGQINWVYPKSPLGDARDDQKATEAQQQYVIDFLNEFYTTLSTPDLNDPNGYSKYIDVDAWIGTHLVNVLTQNVDALGLSTFFYKHRDGKLIYGPPWDCNLCMDSNSGRDDNPYVWYDGGANFFAGDPWYRPLFQDPNFWQLYVDHWTNLRRTVWSDEAIDGLIDRLSSEVAESVPRNSARWERLQKPRRSSTFDTGVLNGTWAGEIEHLRIWFRARTGFIDANFVGPPRMRVNEQMLTNDVGVVVDRGSQIELMGPEETLIEDTKLISGDPGVASGRYFVPADDTLAESWTQSGFDDSAWTSAPLGIGYSGGAFDEAIRTEVRPDDMAKGSTTVLVRIPFQVDDLETALEQQLVLRMKYDDGYIAYLNGQPVVTRNLLDEPLAWNSRAINRLDSSAVAFQEVNITEFRELLVQGSNTLAIRGINSRASSNDLLILPELVSRSVNQVESITGNTYYTLDGSDPRGSDGNPTATAQLAIPGQKLVIDENMRVTARVLDTTDRGPDAGIVLTNWGAPTAYNFVVDNLPVVISELHYHPAAASDAELAAGFDTEDFEFVELFNFGSTSVNLLGSRLKGGIEFEFGADGITSLDAGSYAIVVANADAFRLRYGDQHVIAGQYTGRLDNNGEQIRLIDGADRIVFAAEYSDDDPWPLRADGAGASLELIDAVNAQRFEDRPAKYYDWQASRDLGGTPSTPSNSQVGVVINEVISNSAGGTSRPDSIELFNTAGHDIPVGGWYLSDTIEAPFKFQIPSGTVIGAGHYLVFDESDFNSASQKAAGKGFGLSADQGEDLWLVAGSPLTGIETFVDDVHFGASAAGESLARIPNGQGRLIPARESTFGDANGDRRVGPLVITEVNYNPGPVSDIALAIDPELSSGDLEYIEIRNVIDAAVDLTNWRVRAGVRIDFEAAVQLGSGNVLLVISFNPAKPENASRVAAFRAHYGLTDDVMLVGGYDGQLSNDGDLVRLLGPDRDSADPSTDVPRILVDEILYDDAAPWPIQADGFGDSLHRAAMVSVGSVVAAWSRGAPTPGLVTAELSGDVDGNGSVDEADINRFFVQLRLAVYDPVFDLNGDQRIDENDRDRLIIGILNSQYGDVDLDGVFASNDLLRVLELGEYEDEESENSTWESGDWNGDGEFTSDDLILALASGAFSNNARDVDALLSALPVDHQGKQKKRL